MKPGVGLSGITVLEVAWFPLASVACSDDICPDEIQSLSIDQDLLRDDVRELDAGLDVYKRQSLERPSTRGGRAASRPSGWQAAAALHPAVTEPATAATDSAASGGGAAFWL